MSDILSAGELLRVMADNSDNGIDLFSGLEFKDVSHEWLNACDFMDLGFADLTCKYRLLKNSEEDFLR